MIFTNELFLKIKAENVSRGSFLVGISYHLERCRGLVTHLNELFSRLPKDMQENRDFVTRLTSSRSDAFRGAFGELVTCILLQRYTSRIIYTPKIGPFTPDFYVETDHHSFMVESFCIGRSPREEEIDSKQHFAAEEIRKFKSKRGVIIEGVPVPDENGQFSGLGQLVLDYVNALKSIEKRTKHVVTTPRKATVVFNVHESATEGNLFLGSIGPIISGDHQATMIENQLVKKIEKYRFPFLVSCVVDTVTRADLSTMIKALVGTPAISFQIDKDKGGIVKGSEQSTYSYDGFWGQKHQKFERNHLVQGFLFTRIGNADEGLNFYSHMMENPHFRTGLDLVFTDIPDLVKTKCEEGIENLPPMQFR